MSIAQQTRDALKQLSPFPSGSQLLAASCGAQRLECELVALDTLGCAFLQMVLHDDTLAGCDLERLKRVSTWLTSKINYLLEPISTIEVDTDRCVVQMRSNPPQSQADQTSYYELLVKRDGDITLGRYSVQPGQIRQRIAAGVTREVLLRLVEDFSTAAELS